jgi:hypothetical protein
MRHAVYNPPIKLRINLRVNLRIPGMLATLRDCQ